MALNGIIWPRMVSYHWYGMVLASLSTHCVISAAADCDLTLPLHIYIYDMIRLEYLIQVSPWYIYPYGLHMICKPENQDLYRKNERKDPNLQWNKVKFTKYVKCHIVNKPLLHFSQSHSVTTVTLNPHYIFHATDRKSFNSHNSCHSSNKQTTRGVSFEDVQCHVT